jgi:hypothetical protein
LNRDAISKTIPIAHSIARWKIKSIGREEVDMKRRFSQGFFDCDEQGSGGFMSQLQRQHYTLIIQTFEKKMQMITHDFIDFKHLRNMKYMEPQQSVN